MTTVGMKIRESRELLGMTQEDLAKKLGYKSKSTINKIEMGINDITQSKIVAFADVLNTTPAHLMGWDESGDIGSLNTIKDENYYLDKEAYEMIKFLRENPDYKAVVDATRNVSKEDLEVVKRIIDGLKK